jgi:membrane protein implicated in regulation of membrane protease activity
VYLQHITSLQFLTFVVLNAAAIIAVARLLPGRAAPVRHEPYAPEELAAHDSKLAKYFAAGAAFLVLGSLHMVIKNVPPVAEWEARAGYAGHLVRDLSNTHVMIVGGGTLIATGLCWYVLPRIVGRPLASNGLAQAAFWLTAAGLLGFYVALIANGIAIGRLVEHGWDYQVAKTHMGNWYRVPVGASAGVMGMGYWCFAANVGVTVFQARLVHVPKPSEHLWKFLATGAAALTVGTVQGVIQVAPKNANWLYTAQHAGEWIDPISHAHINLVTGLTMLVAGSLFYLVPLLGGTAPPARLVNRCYWLLLGGSLAFYATALYLGFHEGRLVVSDGLTPERAEAATPLHPFLIMGAGVAMMAAFWMLLWLVTRSMWRSRSPVRLLVLAGCGALAVGTLQGPVQAFPAVNDLLDESGDAGDVIVNLHAQLNMLGGLMPILMALALVLMRSRAAEPWPRRHVRVAAVAVAAGMGVYYAAGIAFAAVAAHRVTGGASFGAAVASLEPWSALVLVPAALAVGVGFGAFALATWRLTAGYRRDTRAVLRAAPAAYTGRIPRRVRRLSPIALAVRELPMGLLGFPGVGWLFAGFPVRALVLLTVGPALAWAAIPLAFSPFGAGPLRHVGWKVEFLWLPLSALLSAAVLHRAHRSRLRRSEGLPRGPQERRRSRGSRGRVVAGVGAIALVLVALPLVPAVSGLGVKTLRYAYETRFTKDVTGQFLTMPRGQVRLFDWRDPQSPYPADALRVHARDVRGLLVRSAAVDRPGAYQLFDVDRGATVALVTRRRSHTALALAPMRPLRVGRYLLVASHEGMFGDRDFVYLSVVAPGRSVTPIGGGSRTSVPTVARSLLPVGASLLAALFTLLLLRSFRRRRAGEKLLWMGGFVLFTASTASEAIAQGAGWSPSLFRTYYLCGGVLTVAWLGAGSAWLQLPRRWRDALTGGLVVATLAATVAVALAPVHAGALALASSGGPPADDALGGHAFVWAIALNSFGTVFLLGGALYSIARRRRVRANLWIASGALVLALSTSLTRAGAYSLVYLGELVGIALMFAGFNLTGSKPKTASAAPEAPVGEPRGAVAAS